MQAAVGDKRGRRGTEFTRRSSMTEVAVAWNTSVALLLCCSVALLLVLASCLATILLMTDENELLQLLNINRRNGIMASSLYVCNLRSSVSL
jgi:hypothetical protein